MIKNPNVIPENDVPEFILQDILDDEDARRAFPSPTDIATKQAERLSSMLHLWDENPENPEGRAASPFVVRKPKQLQDLDDTVGVPGFDGLEGIERIEVFAGFEGINSIQAVLNEHPVDVLTLVRLIGLERQREAGRLEIKVGAFYERSKKYSGEQSDRASKPRKLIDEKGSRIIKRYAEKVKAGNRYGAVKELASEFDVHPNTVGNFLRKVIKRCAEKVSAGEEYGAVEALASEFGVDRDKVQILLDNTNAKSIAQ